MGGVVALSAVVREKGCFRVIRPSPVTIPARDFAAVGVLVCLCAASAPVARADDVVAVRVQGSRSVTRLEGEVIDYTGKELRLRRTTGREERIPADRVIEIQSTWCPAHCQAQMRCDAGDFQEAIPLWQKALADEQRPWVRRMILARLVRCHFELGQFDVAGDLFKALIESDPQTPYLAAIPIPWGEVGISTQVEAKAAGWLSSPHSALQLMGAAWTLTSPKRTEAQTLLARLTGDADARIAWLATAQLWRVEFRSHPSLLNLRQWQSTVERMPPELRAGPYFVLAQAFVSQNDSQAAILAFLRVALLYPDQRRLARQALWTAALLLEKTDRQAYIRLLRELVERFPEADQVPEAKRRLDESPH